MYKMKGITNYNELIERSWEEHIIGLVIVILGGIVMFATYPEVEFMIFGLLLVILSVWTKIESTYFKTKAAIIKYSNKKK